MNWRLIIAAIIAASTVSACGPVPHGAAWNYLVQSCLPAAPTAECRRGATSMLRWKSKAEMERLNANATAVMAKDLARQRAHEAAYAAARANQVAPYGGEAGFEAYQKAILEAQARRAQERSPRELACQWMPGLPAGFQAQALANAGCTANDVTLSPYITIGGE